MSSDFIKMSWPIILEKPRKRAVGKDAALSLAARTVVGLIIGIANPLHGGAAHGAGLPEPAVHGHARSEGGYLFRKAIPRLRSKTLDPLEKHLPRGREQALGIRS